jgi:hypothetical protein
MSAVLWFANEEARVDLTRQLLSIIRRRFSGI